MGTMMMVLIVFACIDKRNSYCEPYFAPLPIGISVIVIGKFKYIMLLVSISLGVCVIVIGMVDYVVPVLFP